MSQDQQTPLRLDLLWGNRAISNEINRTARQTFYLLETGQIPARKIGGRWCASRTTLREFFATVTAGDVARKQN
jgi:hypothetical protein